MRLDFKGRAVDAPEIRAGFIGCGSHSFRNVFPTFQFAPVKLIATCDLDLQRAELFATKFGAQSAYSDYKRMLAEENLDAVFVVVGYDKKGIPLYPKIAVDCLNAGCHTWIEKPPAATCKEIDLMQTASEKADKNVVVGMKKMFFPANEKAKELMAAPDFGNVSQVLLQYPQSVPTDEEFSNYNSCRDFLDHLCHPTSLMVYLLGMPISLYFERSNNGSGLATFKFENGSIASIALTKGSSPNAGMERTTIIADSGKHIVVENNLRVYYHCQPLPGYGDVTDYYKGTPQQVSSVWEPEFSLGQLYNKGLFLLGYYNEVNEFAMSILENRTPAKGTLKQAWQVTRIFEAFTEGAGKLINLK